MRTRQKRTYLKLVCYVASILLISAISVSSADNSNDPQDCKKYGMVANDEGWCVPVMKLTGDLQKIFSITRCQWISGLTCRISYNGKLPLPSEVFFIELDKEGRVVGKKTRLIYPKLEPGETGYATFRINSDSTAKIVLSRIWKGPYKNPY
jgi:hypothetical protein